MSTPWKPSLATDFKRCAAYGRYSTIMQRPASLEDQLRSCQEYASERDWVILQEHVYADAGKSGTSTAGRAQFENLTSAAEQQPRPFDCVLFDDTARCARNLSDILNFVALMTHHGIQVCFVSQGLDSSQDNFTLMLQIYGMFDEQHIARLRKRIHSSMVGRILAGFHVGSIPYGYRGNKVKDDEHPDAVGRASTKGTLLHVIEEEAVVVRRIFSLYAEGQSLINICQTLNQEGVPSPKNARSGKKRGAWDPSSIKRILHNEKYRGINAWNLSYQKEHPVTNRITKVSKAAHEHHRIDAPHLRIVSNEVWEKAHARLQQFSDKQVARVAGGYNRAVSQPYLYSGMLICGPCGSRMKIDGVRGKSRYVCPNHRKRMGCTNSLAIPENHLTAQVTNLIATQLFAPEYLSHLVAAVSEELQQLWREQMKSASKEEVPELERKVRELREKVDNLLDAVEGGEADAVQARLSRRQFELKQADDQLKLAKGKRTLRISTEDLERTVKENVGSLLELLKADAPAARMFLQQHMTKLLLYPGETEAGPAFAVVGEIDIFSEEKASKRGVLLGCEGTLTDQQHADHFYRFFMQLSTTSPLECQLVGPFCALLQAQPDLSLSARTPTAWAELLRDFLPDSLLQEKTGYGAVTRCFRVHRAILEERLVLVKIPNPASLGHLYQLSLRGGKGE